MWAMLLPHAADMSAACSAHGFRLYRWTLVTAMYAHARSCRACGFTACRQRLCVHVLCLSLLAT